MKTYTGLIVSFFLAFGLGVTAHAQERKPTVTEQQCQAILQAYGEIQVSAKQAKLTAEVQAGIVQVCQKLIKAEEPKPTPEPKAEEVK